MHDPHVFSVEKRRAYFLVSTSEYASGACVPGSRYRFVRKAAIGRADPPEYAALVPGDPHTRVTAWPKTDAELTISWEKHPAPERPGALSPRLFREARDLQ